MHVRLGESPAKIDSHVQAGRRIIARLSPDLTMSGSSAAGLVALYCARWLEGLGDGRPEGGSPVLEGSLPFVCSGREVDPAASLYARELAWVSSPQGTLIVCNRGGTAIFDTSIGEALCTVGER